MINVKNRTKYHLQNKLKQFISHIFILFRKSLKGLKSSNLEAKSLKVRALGIQLRAVIHRKVLPAYTHCCVCLLPQWCSGSYCCISNAPISVVCAAYCQTFFFLLKSIASGGVQQQQYGAPFVKILYLTDLAQKVLSLRIYSYLCTDLIISAHFQLSLHAVMLSLPEIAMEESMVSCLKKNLVFCFSNPDKIQVAARQEFPGVI